MTMPSPLRIAMLCEFYRPGLQFQENQLVKYLRKKGHEVIVLTSLFDDVFAYYDAGHYPKGQAWTESDHGATIHHLPYRFNLLNKLRPLHGVYPLLEHFAPDVILLHDIIPNTAEVARYCRRHPRVRAAMDIHMDYSNSGKNWISLRILHGLVRRHYLNIIRPHLTRIFPTYPAATEFMREVYAIPDSEMDLLPLGPDGDLIAEVRSRFDRDAQRRALGFSPQDVVLFTGGKITPRKRTELILEAMRSEELVHCKLVIVGQFEPGDTAYRARIEGLAAEMPDRVHFAGWQDPQGTYRHMLLSDIAIFPASHSVMWQQSIGCGLPLIVGDTGHQDPSYLNRHGNVLIATGENISSEGYRAMLAPLAASRDLRTEMAAGAQRTYEEFLDWNRIADRIVAIAG